MGRAPGQILDITAGRLTSFVAARENAFSVGEESGRIVIVDWATVQRTLFTGTGRKEHQAHGSRRYDRKRKFAVRRKAFGIAVAQADHRRTGTLADAKGVVHSEHRGAIGEQ